MKDETAGLKVGATKDRPGGRAAECSDHGSTKIWVLALSGITMVE
jgi:hypothetical protein